MILYRIRRSALLILIGLLFVGCPLMDEIEELQGNKPDPCEAGRETDSYFAQAIGFEGSGGQWIFHNWRGSGPDGGCDVSINVYDSQLPAGPDITPVFVRQSIHASVERWVDVIRQMGIPCRTRVLSESAGDSLTAREPRIDVHFVKAINTTGTGGRTEIEYSNASRTFSAVQITLATTFVHGRDTVPMSTVMMASLVMHEFGHALGVAGFNGATGHSGEPADVMYHDPVCVELSTGDIETFQRIYSENAFYHPGNSPAAGAQKIVVDGCRGLRSP